MAILGKSKNRPKLNRINKDMPMQEWTDHLELIGIRVERIGSMTNALPTEEVAFVEDMFGGDKRLEICCGDTYLYFTFIDGKNMHPIYAIGRHKSNNRIGWTNSRSENGIDILNDYLTEKKLR
jgi:hypothetical protein